MKHSEHCYDDIINLPHHVSPNRPKMSIADRAAQFAPFKAMVGLEDEITEVARLTDEKLEISDEDLERLNKALNEIKLVISNKPKVQVLFYVADDKKTGGKYLRYTGNVRHIDEAAHRLFFTDGKSIDMQDIYELSLVEESKE